MKSEIAPRLLKPRQVMAMISVGNTKLYDLINQGRLDVLKDGASTYITPESVDRYISSLQPRQPKQHAA
ncbi:helix-turn-helix domain-containing protein [Bradyrhizobium sp. 26S5]|uniref:helix-turn-helix domain-containing protein n=1 Tax=Bradyrhizobium sp. 26S5 TaxID=3139729 RepID=UPI0030D4F981